MSHVNNACAEKSYLNKRFVYYNNDTVHVFVLKLLPGFYIIHKHPWDLADALFYTLAVPKGSA